ncbi:MAG TPA: ABC transporter ATP-binding protein [Stellaceae bacterium]|nr:ABC transporter ATP-binding protein [Stellaceae bacterium]
MAAVELRGLTKRYGALAVVDRIDLAVEHGSLVCLLGPSGCGKTTTLRLIAGFLDPDEGEILVGGTSLSTPGRVVPPERRNMSMIFQSYALWPHMTIAQNVGYGLVVRKRPKSEIERRVREMLTVTKMERYAERYPAELSGGQQQRVALARALVVKPEILLLDEPLSNLDANLREEMRFELRRLHDEYRYTTIYVTHDQVEAMTAADRIVVMREGRIEQMGTPGEIYERPATAFVARFIGGTNILRGNHIGGNVVRCTGMLLQCGQGTVDGQSEIAVSIRPHEVRLAAGSSAEVANRVRGRVEHQVYLGATRDYLIRLPGDATVRVVTPREVDIPAGHDVTVEFPPAACRALRQ